MGKSEFSTFNCLSDSHERHSQKTLFKEKMKNKRAREDTIDDEEKQEREMKKQLMEGSKEDYLTLLQALESHYRWCSKSEIENRKDYWLCEGIRVRVKSKDKVYYKEKGFVRKVIDKYVAEIELLESKHVLRVYQRDLETVIPHSGGLVRIVNGAYRGFNGILLDVNIGLFCAKVQILQEIDISKEVCGANVVLDGVGFEDISEYIEF